MTRVFALSGLAALLIACPPPASTPGASTLAALDFGSHFALDLSHDFGEDTIYWPTASPFELERVFAGTTELGFFYAANRFRGAEHGGTHLDAPIHFGEGRQGVDEIPLERLMGPGVVVDVAAQCENDPGTVIGVGDLEAWESVNGAIPEGAIVLLHTGFARHWPNRTRYLGTDRRGEDAVAHLRFPGLGEDAARWLVVRRISALGIDTASIDPGASRRFESHQVLAAGDVPVFENLTQLDALPATGFAVIALPMKIRGGSGAPLRAVAFLPK